MAKIVKNPSGYHSSGRTLQEKANNFGLFVKEYDWSGGYNTLDNGDVKLEVRRGESEVISIHWYKAGGGVVNYTLAGETTKCRNVSAAALIAQKQPDHGKLRKAVRRKKAAINLESGGELVSSELIASLQGSLPFDHESSEVDLKAVLKNRQITWVNRISGNLHNAVVTVNKQFKLDGKRNITFIDGTGAGAFPAFRCVALETIVSVG